MKETILMKAILKAIKEHNLNREELGEEYNRNIKIIGILPYEKCNGAMPSHGTQKHCEYPNADKGDYNTCIETEDVYIRLKVDCQYRPKNKCDPNVTIYEVKLISSGEIVIYYDGCYYLSNP